MRPAKPEILLDPLLITDRHVEIEMRDAADVGPAWPNIQRMTAGATSNVVDDHGPFQAWVVTVRSPSSTSNLLDLSGAWRSYATTIRCPTGPSSTRIFISHHPRHHEWTACCRWFAANNATRLHRQRTPLAPISHGGSSEDRCFDSRYTAPDVVRRQRLSQRGDSPKRIFRSLSAQTCCQTDEDTCPVRWPRYWRLCVDSIPGCT